MDSNRRQRSPPPLTSSIPAPSTLASPAEINAAKELQSGKPAEVLLTYIVNEKEFFIIFEELLNELSALLGSEDVSSLSPLLEIQEGVLALAPYGEELCRVKVKSIDPFNVGQCDAVRLNFIDYGNEEIVAVEDLKMLPEKYANIPSMATKMLLRSGKVLTKNLVENELIIVTPIEMLNQTTWLTTVEDKWTEDEKVKEIETPVLISKELFDVCQHIKTLKDENFNDHEEHDSDYDDDVKDDYQRMFIREVEEHMKQKMKIMDEDDDSNEDDQYESNVEIDTSENVHFKDIILKLNLQEDQQPPTPNHNVMKVILQRTNYPVLATCNERTFGPPTVWENPLPDEYCKVFCESIPAEILEDELVLLFGRFGVIYSLCLKMNSITEKNLGYCIITYSTKEEADRVFAKRNDFKLQDHKLKIYTETEWKQIPSSVNEVHICEPSNDINLCSCIVKMINDIEKMMVQIKERKICLDSGTIAKAEQANLIRYVHHSLLIESVSITRNKRNTVKASNFACNIQNEFKEQHIKQIFEYLKVGEQNYFRKVDMEEVIIIGLYEEIIAIPPASEIQSSIRKILCDLDKEFRHVIVKASFISVNYVLLHPHPDGNGRISRIIFNMILHKAGFPFVAFPLQEKIKYFEAIKLARYRNDYTLYHRFVCRCIIRSLQYFLATL